MCCIWVGCFFIVVMEECSWVQVDDKSLCLYGKSDRWSEVRKWRDGEWSRDERGSLKGEMKNAMQQVCRTVRQSDPRGEMRSWNDIASWKIFPFSHCFLFFGVLVSCNEKTAGKEWQNQRFRSFILLPFPFLSVIFHITSLFLAFSYFSLPFPVHLLSSWRGWVRKIPKQEERRCRETEDKCHWPLFSSHRLHLRVQSLLSFTLPSPIQATLLPIRRVLLRCLALFSHSLGLSLSHSLSHLENQTIRKGILYSSVPSLDSRHWFETDKESSCWRKRHSIQSSYYSLSSVSSLPYRDTSSWGE